MDQQKFVAKIEHDEIIIFPAAFNPGENAFFCELIFIGTLMYLIEGAENGFTSIPVSIYWAIVTVTTVGYGDIAPITPLGQFFASCLMIVGYAIIGIGWHRMSGMQKKDLSVGGFRRIDGNSHIKELGKVVAIY